MYLNQKSFNNEPYQKSDHTQNKYLPLSHPKIPQFQEISVYIVTFNEIVLFVDDPFSLNQHRFVIVNLALILEIRCGDHFVQTHHQISPQNLVVENNSLVQVSEDNWES